MTSTFSVITEENLAATSLRCIFGKIGIRLSLINKSDITAFGYKIITDLVIIHVQYGDAKQARGQPMLDVLVYNGDVTERLFTDKSLRPVLGCEITKNDQGDSGNMCYQRIEKFVWAQNFWGGEDITYLMLYNIELENPGRSKTYEISNRTLKTLGCSIVEVRKGSETEIDCPPYTNLNKFVQHINSTQRRRGVPNRLHPEINEDGDIYKITIQSNLYHTHYDKKTKEKKEPTIHDPNIGFVSGVVAVIHKFNRDCEIIISDKCRLTQKLLNSKGKLWTCLKNYNQHLRLFEGGRKEGDVWIAGKEYTKDWKQISSTTCETDCYAKRTEGEKLSSLYLQTCLEFKGWQTMFHNHGGCERSWLYIEGECYRLEKQSNLPDLVMYNPVTKDTLIIEAKKNKPPLITGAISQVTRSVEWVKRNIKKNVEEGTFERDFHLKKGICVYGGNIHHTDICPSDTPLLLSILGNGDIRDSMQLGICP